MRTVGKSRLLSHSTVPRNLSSVVLPIVVGHESNHLHKVALYGLGDSAGQSYSQSLMEAVALLIVVGLELCIGPWRAFHFFGIFVTVIIQDQTFEPWFSWQFFVPVWHLTFEMMSKDATVFEILDITRSMHAFWWLRINLYVFLGSFCCNDYWTLSPPW